MKKILIILFALLSTGLMAQVDTIPYISGTTKNKNIRDKLNEAIGQVNTNTLEIDTLNTDTVDVATPAIIVADSGVYAGGYTTPAGTDSKIIAKDKTDIQLISDLFGGLIIAESAVCPSVLASNNSTDLVDGTVYFEAVYVRVADSITGAKALSGASSTYTEDNFNGFSLMKWEVGDTIRQVAISANLDDYFETGDGSTITAAFVEVAGKRYYAEVGLYYVAFLWNSDGAPGTVPEVYCGSSGALASIAVTPTGKRMSATLATQATIPTKIKLSDLTANTAPKWVGLY